MTKQTQIEPKNILGCPMCTLRTFRTFEHLAVNGAHGAPYPTRQL